MTTPSTTADRESPVLAETPRRANDPLNEISSEPQDYRHLPFRPIGATRVRPGPIQPLPVRRFTLEDDEA